MNKSDPPFIYVGTLVHSKSLENLEIITDGIVVVSQRKIVHLSQNENLEDIQKLYDVKCENVHVLGKGKFLIPGFIDTHIHAPQYPNMGIGGDLTLLEWLENYTFPLETKFKDEKFAERVYEAVLKRTISCGTTTSCYFATIHRKASLILAKLAQKFGQRAFIGKVNMIKCAPSNYCETFEESLTETRNFIEEMKALNDPLITPIITPRFALTCDMKLMKSLADLAAEYEIPIQTHLSESKKELEKVAQQFPNYRNYVDVYDAARLITDKTVLAHGIYLKEEEISVLREKNAAISHCPNSNSFLQSGICPVRKLLQAGLKISLGTDCSGGYSISMLDAIRHAIEVSAQAQFDGLGKRLSCAEAFYLATLGGAEALTIADVTGNFQVGKDFDANVVELKDNPAIDLFEDYSIGELFQKFLYLGDDRMITKVYVAGRMIKTS